MPYKKTKRKSKVDVEYRRMRKGKARLREQRAAELGPRTEHELPEVRKIVIVLNLDFGLSIDIFWFRKTNRIDSYLVSNLKMVSEKMGWTVFCKRLSAYYPRLLSPIKLE